MNKLNQNPKVAELPTKIEAAEVKKDEPYAILAQDESILAEFAPQMDDEEDNFRSTARFKTIGHLSPA